MGHLQVRSVSSIRLMRLALFSTSWTLAKASGLISLAEGCGGRGWPAGTIGLRSGVTFDGRGGSAASVTEAGCVGSDGADFASVFLALGAGFASASLAGAALAEVPAPPERFDRPRRCTLPITALRVTPPNSLAIWLAD